MNKWFIDSKGNMFEVIEDGGFTIYKPLFSQPGGCVSYSQENKMDFSINPEGPFKVHMLNEDGKIKAQVLAGAFDQLLSLVLHNCRPDPYRVQSTIQDPAATGNPAVNTEELKQFIFKLQEASFYAKRAMAMLPENQQ